ncbi:MAG: hypothetical protein U0176_17255 [Bacteroidia bacterium]
MKRFYLPFLLMLLGLWVAMPTMAQDKPHTKRLWWGINGGGAWQCSDVRTTGGGGFGTTLGIPLIENDHSLLGLELRGRYLWTATYGKDLKSTIDASFPGGINYRNHRTSATNWDLELMLTANRLRAKTGMLLYVWGGVGAMGFKAKQNNYDENISVLPYNYTTIGTSSVFNVKTELDFLRDWTYETRVHPQRWPWVADLPLGGHRPGLRVCPQFRMAAEWKVTFPQTDLLDGYVQPNDNHWGYDKDIHHYVGLNLDFGLFGGGVNHTTYTPPTDPNTYTPKGDGPSIVMVTPTGPHTDYNTGCAIEIPRAALQCPQQEPDHLHHEWCRREPSSIRLRPHQRQLHGPRDPGPRHQQLPNRGPEPIRHRNPELHRLVHSAGHHPGRSPCQSATRRKYS